jgi:UDP-galactopyranose mutase
MARHVFDDLVVGAGFARSVLAQRLAPQLDQSVLSCHKRKIRGCRENRPEARAEEKVAVAATGS